MPSFYRMEIAGQFILSSFFYFWGMTLKEAEKGLTEALNLFF